MGAHRFFVNKFDDMTAAVSGGDYDHAVNVLRLKPGDTVNVFNYDRGEYEAEVVSLDAKSRVMKVKAVKLVRQRQPASSTRINAYICVIKKDNMEFVLEKMTELGIDKITPVMAKRTVVKIKEEEKKAKRWESIIYSAVKQCGRLSAPELGTVLDGVEKIDAPEGPKYFIYEKAEGRFLMDEAVKLTGEEKEISFIIGPEGGFEEGEAEILEKKGFIPVSIGDTILRAETAAIAAGTVLVQALRRSRWKE